MISYVYSTDDDTKGFGVDSLRWNFCSRVRCRKLGLWQFNDNTKLITSNLNAQSF